MSSLPTRLDDALLPPAALGRGSTASSGARSRTSSSGTSLLRRPEPVRLGDLKPLQPLHAGLKRRESEDEGVFSMEIDLPDATSAAMAGSQSQAGQLLPPPPPQQRSSTAPVQRSASSGSLPRPVEPSRSKSGSLSRTRAPGDERADKKPRRSGSASGAVSLPVTPLFGPASARGTPMLGPLVGPASRTSSRAGSTSGSPLMSGLSGSFGSPTMSGLHSLVPVEADLQPNTMLRSHEFQAGRRVFHVHFGHGFVRSLEAEIPKPEPGQAPAQPEAQRVLTQKTHNINVHFDNPKYKQLRLRAFYAVPKMVVIPSSAALRKQKLAHAAEVAPLGEAHRVALIHSLLASGSIRGACALVARWKLVHLFDGPVLLEQLLQSRCFSAAVRFAREFGLSASHPASAIFGRMLDEKHYEGALKHVGATCASVDGHRSPADVLQMMVGAGNHAVALKYVHKFGAKDRFPPSQLVSRCLQQQGELTVRTCGLLLKYVRLFELESLFPIAALLERVVASGVTVHEMDGKYVLKGRKRRSMSQPGASSTSMGCLGGTPSSTPGTSPHVAATI